MWPAARETPRATIVLVWRYDEATFGEVSRLFDILKTGKHGGLVAAVIFAGIDLADRHADLTQRIALVVQIALGGDIVEIEWIGIRLVGKRGAVAKNNDQPAGP